MDFITYTLITLIIAGAISWAAYKWLNRESKTEKLKQEEKEREELTEQYNVADELAPVIKRLKTKGLTDKEIIITLTQQGWKKEVITDLLNLLK